jgi:predicted RNase H-like HicB family nuclease
MKYRVLIEQDEEGMFVAEVPALPGCISQGQTRPEVLENIQEAIEAYLESKQDLRCWRTFKRLLKPTSKV